MKMKWEIISGYNKESHLYLVFPDYDSHPHIVTLERGSSLNGKFIYFSVHSWDGEWLLGARTRAEVDDFLVDRYNTQNLRAQAIGQEGI